MIPDPVNPVAAHIGSGTIQIYVPNELPSNLQFYEVQSSASLNGQYYGYSNNRFKRKDHFLKNFPISKTVYLRIRAVATDGSTSNWVQVLSGVLTTPVVEMECRAPVGAEIPADALFCVPKRPYSILGFRTSESIAFSQ